MTKEEKQTAWSIEELIALTDEVQNASVDYRGKDFDFHFCELVEEEEPKIDGRGGEEESGVGCKGKDGHRGEGAGGREAGGGEGEREGRGGLQWRTTHA